METLEEKAKNMLLYVSLMIIIITDIWHRIFLLIGIIYPYFMIFRFSLSIICIAYCTFHHWKRLLLLYAAHAVRWLPRLHKSERHLLRIHYNIICTYQAVLTHIHVRFDASTDIFFVYKFDSSCLHTKCICMQLQWCPLSGYHIHALSFAVTIHFAQKVL